MRKADKIATELMGSLLVAQSNSIKIAEHSADRLDEILGMRWLQIVTAIRKPTGSYQNDVVRTRNLLTAIIHDVNQELQQGLVQTVASARKTTRQAFRSVLPETLREEEITTPLVEARRPKKRVVQDLNENELLRIIRRGKYGERLRRWSSQLTRADRVARILADGIAQGLDPNEIAKQIAPFVKNYFDAAKRIVRTESSRIHNEVLEHTFQQYDDLIAGYQIIGILDDRIRPHHATRHGKIWYTFKAPYADERPTLPDEPNCRCTYTILLRTGARAYGVPAPSTRLYKTWFDRQSVATKQRIVGKRRWQTVRQKIARPSWNDFINPSTGKFIKTETLQHKSSAQIIKTRNQLNKRQEKQAASAQSFK